MKKYINLRIEANDSDLDEFVKFCGAIQYLGAIGASRELRLSVDGDGSARFKFYIKEQQIPYTKLDTGHFPDHFNFYLGE